MEATSTVVSISHFNKLFKTLHHEKKEEKF